MTFNSWNQIQYSQVVWSASCFCHAILVFIHLPPEEGLPSENPCHLNPVWIVIDDKNHLFPREQLWLFQSLYIKWKLTFLKFLCIDPFLPTGAKENCHFSMSLNICCQIALSKCPLFMLMWTRWGFFVYCPAKLKSLVLPSSHYILHNQDLSSEYIL